MKYRDSIAAALAIALSTLVLAGVVSTDAYLQTAKVEVQGVRALTDVASGAVLACADAGLMAEQGGTVQR